MSSVAEFCAWLSETPLSLTLQTVAWVIPALQTVHILAIAMVMASVVMVDLRLLGFVGLRQTIVQVVHRHFPWVWSGLIVLLLSGSALIIAEPARELLNPVFRAKIVLLAAAVAITAGFQASLQRRPVAWDASGRGRMVTRLVALASLALWAAIICCGRWIAYVEQG
jgi:hypothetical protein